jgi:predicted RNA binding protein YcfA (HicA-like mRNA interferase family)
MKVRDLIDRIEADGWNLVRDQGSHKVFKKRGVQDEVVINGHGRDEIPQGTLSKIRKQTGLPLR